MPLPTETKPVKEALLSAFRFRHACKHFDKARQIPGEDLEFVLEAGRLSPSSMGLEHWKFIVVRTPALKAQLQGACGDQPQLGSCSAAVVILAKKAELAPDSEYVRALLKREVPPAEYEGLLRFYADFAHHVDLVAWSVAQCHIAAANMMTAAAAIGIDSCPIGGFDPAAVREVLDIDGARYEVALILPLGYRAQPQPPRYRLPLEALVEYR